MLKITLDDDFLFFEIKFLCPKIYLRHHALRFEVGMDLGGNWFLYAIKLKDGPVNIFNYINYICNLLHTCVKKNTTE